MKLVYVIEDFSENGGVERIVAEKANIFSNEFHHEVTIISIYKDSREIAYKFERNVKLLQLNVPMAKKSNNFLATTLSRICTLFKAYKSLNQTIKTIRPDIIFFATTLSALLLPLCKTKAKRIFESHSARKFTPYNFLFPFMERKADIVVCLTRDDAKEYRYAKDVRVIPNFINSPHRFVSDYGIKRAIAVGRLEHVKGFDILIDCWRSVVEKHPDWQLHIYGEGSMCQQLQEQIDCLDLKERVKLCGRCENIMERYCDYSLLLMTSRYEGLPMVLIESLSVGLPAVTFNFKYGASDIVNNEENGILVEQGDKKSFVEAMDRMMSSEQLRTQYGLKAKGTLNRFSRGSIFQRWIDLINELKA